MGASSNPYSTRKIVTAVPRRTGEFYKTQSGLERHEAPHHTG